MTTMTTTVTIARPTFDYQLHAGTADPRLAGQRATAVRGQTIEVCALDYARGVVHSAFVDVPAPETTRVTVAQGLFTFTPTPYPAGRPEGFQETALRGAVIEVQAGDLERGVRHGAFVEFLGPAPRYAPGTEPPIHGGTVDWLNWAQHATDDTLATFAEDLDAAAEQAADVRAARAMAAETIRLLTPDTGSDLVAMPGESVEDDVYAQRRRPPHPSQIDRAQQLAQLLMPLPVEAETARLVEMVRTGAITDRRVVAAILGAA